MLDGPGDPNFVEIVSSDQKPSRPEETGQDVNLEDFRTPAAVSGKLFAEETSVVGGRS